MSSIKKWLFFLFFPCSLSAVYFIQDSSCSAFLPKNSRAFFNQRLVIGSGQFSQENFKHILDTLPNKKNLWVIDLREESHGFINGTAVTWYRDNMEGSKRWRIANRNKTREQIEEEEAFYCLKLNQQGIAFDLNSPTTPLLFPKASTERAFIESLGLHYVRFPTSDHFPPSQKVFNEFLLFLTQLPSDATLYFHCRGGKGRTTTFLVLYQILFNREQQPLATILQQQHRSGGSDLLHFSKAAQKDPWIRLGAIQRLSFIRWVFDSFLARC